VWPRQVSISSLPTPSTSFSSCLRPLVPPNLFRGACFEQVGSDFLPAVPSLEVHLGGLDTLVKQYKRLLMDGEGFLTTAGRIDQDRFGALFKRLDNLQERALAAQEVPPNQSLYPEH
jgi:hypothetical protein